MSLEDYQIPGANGKMKFGASLLADALLEKEGFATMRDTDEILYFSKTEHRWIAGGESIIDSLVKEDLGEDYMGRHSDEVKRNIKALTYLDRNKLNRCRDRFNVLTGEIDLKTFKVLLHNKSSYFTYCLPVKFDPEAYPKAILTHLAKVFKDNPKKAIYLLEYVSYILTKGYPLKKALILLGVRDTGKTTTENIISRMMGGDTQANISLHDLCEDTFGAAELWGKLVNIYDELPSMKLSTTEKFKQITGNGTLRANVKFKPAFGFNNEAKQIFGTNTLPLLDNMEDEAFFGRVILVEHINKFEGENRDIYIIDTLTTEAELSGLFNIMLLFNYALNIKGYFEYEKDFDTQAIIELWLAYTENKNEKEFIDSCVQEDAESFVTKEDIHNSYIDFCKLPSKRYPVKDQGVVTKVLKAMRKVVEAREGSRGKRKTGWRGIALQKPRTEDEVELAPDSISIYELLDNYLNSNFSREEDGVISVIGICLKPMLNNLRTEIYKLNNMPTDPTYMTRLFYFLSNQICQEPSKAEEKPPEAPKPEPSNQKASPREPAPNLLDPPAEQEGIAREKSPLAGLERLDATRAFLYHTIKGAGVTGFQVGSAELGDYPAFYVMSELVEHDPEQIKGVLDAGLKLGELKLAGGGWLMLELRGKEWLAQYEHENNAEW